MCNATDDPARERQHLDQLLRKRVDGIVVTARRADTRAPIGPLAHGLPVVYVFSQADDPARPLPPPRRQGRGRARRRPPRRPRPPPHRPRHRPRALRGRPPPPPRAGAPPSPPPACPSSPAPTSPAPGPRPGAARPSPASSAAPAPTPSSAATTRSPAAPPTPCSERGVAVPDDVALVGFDNWEVMTLAARPPLTSIDMNLRALGREAGERLLETIGGAPIERGLPPPLHPRRARLDAKGRSMNKLAPLPFVDVAIEGDFWRERLETVLTRTIPSQHVQLGRARHPRRPHPPRPAAAAALPPQRAQLHRPGLLGLRRRQVDRGRLLRPLPPPRRRHRGEDRGDHRRPRPRPGARRLPQLLVSRPRARQALDQPPRQPRALQPRPPPRRRHRLLPRHRPPPPPRHPRAHCRPRRAPPSAPAPARSAATTATRRSSSP